MNQLIRACTACLILFALLHTSTVNAQVQTARTNVNVSGKCKGYYEYLPQGYDPNGTTTYPLMIFMTGIGEFGNGSTSTSSGLPKALKNGPPKLIAAGTFPTSFNVMGQTFRFIIITPQFLTNSNPGAADVDTVLRYMLAHYKADTTRVYLTGLSYGGGLCFAYAGNWNTSYAAHVAAIVPIANPLPLPLATGSDTIYARSRIIAAASIPVWATHNQSDRYPDSSLNTITYVNDINQSPAPTPAAKMNIFVATGHDAWTKTYDPNFRDLGYNVYEWMLLFKKGSPPPPANAPPTAHASSDKTLTLPTNSVTLTGSGTDPEGGSVTYSWTKVAGPLEGTISTPTAGSTSMTGLVGGVYVFRFTVSDNAGAKAIDDVKVTVKPATGTKAIQVNIYGGSSAYSSTAWNNWNVGSGVGTNVTSTPFKYVDGAVSTVTATLSATNAIKDNGSTYGSSVPTVAPTGVLRHTSQYNALRTLTLQGLSITKTYNLEFYASYNTTASGNTTVFTINGTSVTIEPNNNLTAKAAFAAIAPDTSGKIVISINKTASYNYLNGFTMLENAGSGGSTTRAGITAVEAVATHTAPAGVAGVRVFPNPVSNTVHLQMQNSYTGAVRVQLADASGRTLQEWHYVKSNTQLLQTLPVAGLPKGLYFITVQAGNTRQTMRIIK